MVTRRTYAKSHAKRSAIIEATLSLIDECGHDGFGVADVARRAGVAESTLQYHFPTRDDLLVAAIESAERIHAGEDIDGRLTADPMGSLRIAVQEDSAQPHRLRLFAELLARASDPDHPAHRFVSQHHRLAIDYLATLLRIRQETGFAHPDVDPEKFGREMVAIWDGLQIQWLVRQDFDLADAVSSAFADLSREDVMATKRGIERLVAGL